MRNWLAALIAVAILLIPALAAAHGGDGGSSHAEDAGSEHSDGDAGSDHHDGDSDGGCTVAGDAKSHGAAVVLIGAAVLARRSTRWDRPRRGP